MRLLFLNPIGALGGAERSLLDLFAAIRALEPTWNLYLIVGADGPLIQESERLGVSTEILALPDEMLVLNSSPGSRKTIASLMRLAGRAARAGMGATRCAEELRARIEALKPDIIHSNGSRFHLLTRLLKQLRVPVIWHLRDFVSSRRLMRSALRWAESAASIAVANSHAVAEDARNVLKRLPIRTVLNGIDTERFSPGPGCAADLDKAADAPAAEEGTLRVGIVASYARWKGQRLFLEAAALLKRNAPDLRVRFYIVGGPIFETQGSQFTREELHAHAVELSIAKQVVLLPFQNEPQKIYRSLDIVLHCSTHREPFGRTIAEAMSCGCAVIASFQGGVPELFQDGVEAVGATPNDAADFARKIERLLRNQTERETLGTKARRAACERFSLARLGREMRAIYLEIAR